MITFIDRQNQLPLPAKLIVVKHLPQQARWEAVQQAREKGLSLRAIARKLGMSRDTAGKYTKATRPPTKLLSAKERAKAEALAQSLMAAD